jgi:hypothetical protein
MGRSWATAIRSICVKLDCVLLCFPSLSPDRPAAHPDIFHPSLCFILFRPWLLSFRLLCRPYRYSLCPRLIPNHKNRAPHTIRTICTRTTTALRQLTPFTDIPRATSIPWWSNRIPVPRSGMLCRRIVPSNESLRPWRNRPA